MNYQSEVNDKYLKLAITLKASELQREQLSSLTYQHVEKALVSKWRLKKPASFHDTIKDIMELDANEVVAVLSCDAVISGKRMKINDFEDLFGGEER